MLSANEAACACTYGMIDNALLVCFKMFDLAHNE